MKGYFFDMLDDAIETYEKSTGVRPGQITVNLTTFRLLCREAEPYLTKEDAMKIYPHGNYYCGIPIRIEFGMKDGCISLSREDDKRNRRERIVPELKPCPFCGGKVTYNHDISAEIVGIYCQKCKAHVKFIGIRPKMTDTFGKTMEQYAEKWNRRVQDV